MRKLQPELKALRRQTKGDRQKESLMLMELYKERGVNPIGSIVILIPQFIILIGLYSGLNRVVHDPHKSSRLLIQSLQHLGWMQQLAHNIKQFDETLFGFVDLTRAPSGHGLFIWPAMIIVIASSVAQYFQSKQLMPNDKNARKLRDILKAAGAGKQADQSEVQADRSRSMLFSCRLMIFVVTIGLPAALGLYWLVGGLVAIIQQTIILREDETEMEAIADEPTKKRPQRHP